MYIRKTKDVWALLGDYGQGFEEILTEDTRREALEQLKTYRENEKYPFKIKKYREKISE